MQGVYFNSMSSIRVFLKKGEKMPDLNGLKKIKQLIYLNDSMLENLATITNIIEYKAGDYIFKEGDDAKILYAVIDGKVGLEMEKNSSTRILIDTIIQGMMLGFSALVDTEEKSYTTSARVLTDTKLYAWRAEDLETLFSQNCEMGFLFMKRIATIVKTRLQIRNVQFLDIYK
jgi:CRP/FNR family cyclic AMP-dependent transcriptional regulator